tara:strand:+ start:6880 stop:7638 length:759 start_codon:yes stop_codon:yes gene_type:complete
MLYAYSHKTRKRMEVPTGKTSGGRYVVVFDCESDSLFSTLPGESHEDKIRYMQFTVVSALALPCELIEAGAPIDDIMSRGVVYNWWRDVAEDGNNPLVSLLALFDGAEAIVGYNCNGFDFPLIRRFYRPTQSTAHPVQRYVDHRTKTLDIMSRVKDATGSYMKLDELLKRNGLSSKSSNGKEAVGMWERGERDALKSYCDTDVMLTAKLALLETLAISNVVRIGGAGCGLRAFLASQSATKQAQVDDSFVLV